MDDTKRTSVKTPKQLLNASLISQSDLEQIEEVADRFSIAITAHVHAQIDKDNPRDPIAAQFVPKHEEMQWFDEEKGDP